jgi:hypothetical protein
MTSQNIGLITFAGGDPIWRLAAKRLGIQSRKYENISVYREYNKRSMLRMCSNNEIKHINEFRRGFGLWFWKPRIIIDFLESHPEIDVVIYLDAGCEINSNNRAKTKFDDYLNELNQFNAIVFEMELQEKYWSKSLLVDYLKSKNSDLESGQLVGGAHFMNRDFALSFCQNWRRTIEHENFILLIDSENSQEIADFREHRHDQSIFSLLMKQQKNISVHNNSEEIYFTNFVKDGKEWPIWTARNKSFVSLKNKNILGSIFRLLERVLSKIYRTIRT